MKNINQDVPIEEVNRVIKQSREEEGDGEVDEELSDGDGYTDLSEEAAKEELDSMIVPGSEDAEGLIESCEEEPEEDTAPVKINPAQRINPNQKQPQSMKPINMSLLQFQCSECNYKSYINLDDEIISPMPDKIKCLNCGKKKSVKKRILNITLNGFDEYKSKEVEPYNPKQEDEEDSTEL